MANSMAKLTHCGLFFPLALVYTIVMGFYGMVGSLENRLRAFGKAFYLFSWLIVRLAQGAVESAAKEKKTAEAG